MVGVPPLRTDHGLVRWYVTARWWARFLWGNRESPSAVTLSPSALPTKTQASRQHPEEQAK